MGATPKPGSPLAPLVTTYSYDPIYNKPTQIVDPLGLVTSMSYDGATGNLTTSISDVGSSPHFNAQRSFAYNNVGQVLTATDPLGSITQYGYVLPIGPRSSAISEAVVSTSSRCFLIARRVTSFRLRIRTAMLQPNPMMPGANC